MPRHDFELFITVDDDDDSTSVYEMCIDYTIDGHPMPATDSQPAEGYEIEMLTVYQNIGCRITDKTCICDFVTEHMKEYLAEEINLDLNRKEGD